MEAGAAEAVIVHRLDRWVRSIRLCFESLDRLERASVAFVSITESMDFSTPIGRVVLTTLAAFTEYYSRNLSAETSKGKRERRLQGFHNGALMFGYRLGPDRVAVPGPENAPGLVLAFELVAAGQPDRAIAVALNAAGYRTSGNWGSRPWTKDSVRPLLSNRFSLGELPDGEGG